VIQIRQRLKDAQHRMKSYVDTHRTDRSYKVGYQFLIRIKINKITILFEKGKKLSAQFIGLFKIQERIRPFSYRLILPPHLNNTHNFFHVYVLHHCIIEKSHKIN
jgi:hypothetical protein